MPRYFYRAILIGACFWAIVIGLAVLLAGCGGEGVGDEGSKQGAEKRTLVRNGPYFEITGDGDDYGNYFETYTVPTPWGERRCIVYSDKIGESGGGAGLWCEEAR